MKVGIVDYGVGNYQSVLNLFRNFTQDVIVSGDPVELYTSDILVLPGVGEFGSVMNCIKQNKLDDVIYNFKKSNRKIFGICIGMHILGNTSQEDTKVKGLSMLDFEVVRRELSCHIGWRNIVWLPQSNSVAHNKSNVYFNHSFLVKCVDELVIGNTVGEKIPAIIKSGNIIGFQFHPEKSQSDGRKIIENFLNEN